MKNFIINSRETFLLALGIVLGVLLLVATLLGNFPALGWFGDLFTHFRLQYFVLGLGVLGIFIALWNRPMSEGHPRRWVLLPVLVLLLNGVELSPLFSPRPAVADTKQVTLKLLQMNVLTSNTSHEKVLRYIRSANPDLIALQEIDQKWFASILPGLKQYPYRLVWPREDNFGIALFSKIPLKDADLASYGGTTLPSIVARFEYRDRTVMLVATHPLPPVKAEASKSRDSQLRAVVKAMNQARQKEPKLLCILMGDLNTTPYSTVFRQILPAGNLLDTANGFGIQPTWPTNILPLSIVIDHVLASPEFITVNRKTGPNVGSDHYPLFVELGLR